MILRKGDYVHKMTRNNNPRLNSGSVNSDLIYEVTRVNRKTYTLKCISGYLKGTECRKTKDFPTWTRDAYGTTTIWIQQERW